MAIKTLKYDKLYKNIMGVLSSAILLVTIKAEMRSNSKLLEAAPTPRVAKRGVLNGNRHEYQIKKTIRFKENDYIP